MAILYAKKFHQEICRYRLGEHASCSESLFGAQAPTNNYYHLVATADMNPSAMHDKKGGGGNPANNTI